MLKTEFPLPLQAPNLFIFPPTSTSVNFANADIRNGITKILLFQKYVSPRPFDNVDLEHLKTRSNRQGQTCGFPFSRAREIP